MDFPVNPLGDFIAVLGCFHSGICGGFNSAGAVVVYLNAEFRGFNAVIVGFFSLRHKALFQHLRRFCYNVSGSFRCGGKSAVL